jgi:hypothetical protein
MTTKTKILLGISLASLLISTTGVLWGLFLPVGAITFGLFMIFHLLSREVALFDEEQARRISEAEKSVSASGGRQAMHHKLSVRTAGVH